MVISKKKKKSILFNYSRHLETAFAINALAYFDPQGNKHAA